MRLGSFFMFFSVLSTQFLFKMIGATGSHVERTKGSKMTKMGVSSKKCMKGMKSADLLTCAIDWYRKDFAKADI